MSPTNLEKLRNYLPFWEYYKANKCIPLINLPTLEAIAYIYREELNPLPVRLYCSVCVEEIITTLFYQYEREILISIAEKEQKEIHEINDLYEDQNQSTHSSPFPKESKPQKANPKRRGRKVRRRKK